MTVKILHEIRLETVRSQIGVAQRCSNQVLWERSLHRMRRMHYALLMRIQGLKLGALKLRLQEQFVCSESTTATKDRIAFLKMVYMAHLVGVTHQQT